MILFHISGGTETEHVSCNTTNRYSADKSSEHYQAIIAAFQMGTQVSLGTVKGLGTCNRTTYSEDLQWIEVNR